RAKYGGAALEHLARVVSERNPYAAKHTHKTKAWKDIHEAMKKQGYFRNTSYAGVRNKMTQLLKYQDDPDSVPSINSTLSQSQKTVLAALLDRISENQRSAAMQNDEQKDTKRKATEADRVGGEVIRTQATRNARKQKLADVNIDSDNNSDKENISPYCVPVQLSPPGAPTTKRIRREKMGTEWQSVLDVIKHGEEIRSKQNDAVIEEMKACTAVLE
ncbi:hypothetical protein DFJ58DRAFT_607903, partial [Suillus subalutaceus]|uniref:uncharacterized protein n=1 Tax=Suillus subalutaceus TaxID=48586 RepID=UPI001B86F0D7